MMNTHASQSELFTPKITVFQLLDLFLRPYSYMAECKETMSFKGRQHPLHQGWPYGTVVENVLI